MAKSKLYDRTVKFKHQTRKLNTSRTLASTLIGLWTGHFRGWKFRRMKSEHTPIAETVPTQNWTLNIFSVVPPSWQKCSILATPLWRPLCWQLNPDCWSCIWDLWSYINYPWIWHQPTIATQFDKAIVFCHLWLECPWTKRFFSSDL